MYENNYAILKQMAAEGALLWPPERHKNAAGEYNLAENMAIWNRAVARLESMPLWDNGAPGFDDRDGLQIQPNLVFIPAQNVQGPRGTVIVAHGGAFVCHAGHEGFHTALCFAEKGFNTAVLTYRLKPYSRRDAMADMSRAIRLVRARRTALGLSERVAVLGFSAGGMLAGNCATHYDRGDPGAADPVERESSRPDAAVLCYGAFATVAFPEGLMRAPFIETDRAEKLYLAPEKNVTPDTPPFFIWQTISDDPRNAFVLGSALTEAGVPFDLHCFETGHHGVGLADGHDDAGYFDAHLSRWPELCAGWLRVHGI
jgi:acetyl esterase/lipase